MADLDCCALGHNNDGVDVEMSRNVVIERCRFDQGDDGIAVKSGMGAAVRVWEDGLTIDRREVKSGDRLGTVCRDSPVPRERTRRE